MELARGSMARMASMATSITVTILAMATQGRCRIVENGHSTTSTGMKPETARATSETPVMIQAGNTLLASHAVVAVTQAAIARVIESIQIE